MRSLLSFLLIGVPVTLILTLVGLAHGMLEDSQNRARGVGADVVVRGASTTSVVNLGPPAVSEGYVKFLSTEVPPVRMALGEINPWAVFRVGRRGFNRGRSDGLRGGFEFVAGHQLGGRDD